MRPWHVTSALGTGFFNHEVGLIRFSYTLHLCNFVQSHMRNCNAN